jgi:NADH-ubiquinone oxidoreductase chain 1
MIYMYIIEYIDYEHYINIINNVSNNNWLFNPLEEGMLYGLILGIKTCFMIFVFIWVRASFPRIRFDQLMSYCWIILLPFVLAIIILIPCIIYSCDILPTNIVLF